MVMMQAPRLIEHVLLVLALGCAEPSPATKAAELPRSPAATGFPTVEIVPVAASGLAATTAAPRAPRPAPLRSVPALWAPMFEAGRTWTVHIDSTSEFWDGNANKSVTNRRKSQGSCEVVDSYALTWAHISEVTCINVEDNGVPQPITGFWVATSDGLFRTSTKPTDRAALVAHEIVFAWPMQPSDVESKDPTEPGFGERIVVRRETDRWCHSHNSWGGDEGWQTLCIAPKIGLASANWGWSGGSTHDNSLVVVSSTMKR